MSLSVTGNSSTSPLDLIQYDVWGPALLLSIDGHWYFVIFMDEFSKFRWLFPMKNKSEVYSIFIDFQSVVEHQFGKQIKSFQSDEDGEYQNLQNILNPMVFFTISPVPKPMNRMG